MKNYIKKIFSTKYSFIFLYIGFHFCGIGIYNLVKPMLSYNIYMWLLQIVLIELSVVLLAISAQFIIRTIFKEFKSPSEECTKYLVKFSLTNGDYTLVSNEQEYNKIIDLFRSDEELYTIEKENGFLRISKTNLVELTAEKISSIRQAIEPILYIAKNPISCNGELYIKALAISLLGIMGYMYFNNIPFVQLLHRNSNSVNWLMSALVIINTSFGLMYSLNIAKSTYNVLNKRRFGQWTTYAETMSYKVVNSLAYNGLAIIIFSCIFLSLKDCLI